MNPATKTSVASIQFCSCSASLTDRVAPEKFVKNLVTSPIQTQITNARETVQTLAALSSNPSEILNKYEELRDKK